MKKTNPLKIVEIENYANNLRKELGIPSNSFFPVLEVMEKFHVDGLLTIQYLEEAFITLKKLSIKKIIELDNAGMFGRDIAIALSISRNSVAEVLNTAKVLLKQKGN